MLVVKAPEPFALAYEQTAHLEALQYYGEKVIVRLVWHAEDVAAGLVVRCTHCQGTDDDALSTRLSNLYKQAGDSHCEFCFGTSFEGGFEPVIYVTWMLAQDVPLQRKRDKSGQIVQENPSAQFPWTPRMQDGDLIIRVRSWADDGVTPLVEEERAVLGTVQYQSIRVSPEMGADDSLLVAQTGSLSKLPANHGYYLVPLE